MFSFLELLRPYLAHHSLNGDLIASPCTRVGVEDPRVRCGESPWPNLHSFSGQYRDSHANSCSSELFFFLGQRWERIDVLGDLKMRNKNSVSAVLR